MAQARRPRGLSARAVSTTPERSTAGNIPACSQPRSLGLRGVSAAVTAAIAGGAEEGSLSAASGAEVMAQCYLRDRKLLIHVEVVTVTKAPSGQNTLTVG